jgi:osmotically-inducible protein OsmY
LRTAPSFEKNDWSQTENQQFTSEVYRFYHQTPYWQTSGEIREPSGTQQLHRRDSRDSSSEWQRGSRNYESDIEEPSGAAPSAPAPGGELNEPSPQAEPERYQSQPQSQQDESQSSAQKETSELQSTPQYQGQQAEQQQSQDSQVQQEPAGATTESTAPATSQDQAPSDADRQLSQKLTTALQTDSVLSPLAEKVQISAANGRITLRGTVETEQQKQSIAAKAQQITASADKVDNQLKVSGSSTP